MIKPVKEDWEMLLFFFIFKRIYLRSAGAIAIKEKQIPYNITYTWNLKYDINELTYEPETDSQAQKKKLWLRGEVGEG